MSRNSFQELQALQEERYRQQSIDTQKKVNSSLRLFQFIGDILELFLPKVVQVFISATSEKDNDFTQGPGAPGRKPDEEEPRYPDTPI